MKSNLAARRDFLLQLGGVTGTALVNAQWPAIVAAAQHAHETAKARGPQAFEVLTPAQAKEVEAITAQIIPTDELPGAREAGVVYFIDRALKTFASDARPVYEKGITDLNKLTAEEFPGVMSFSAATPEQQQKIISEMMGEMKPQRGARRRAAANSDFLQTIWQHTVFGFLVDPEGGGNRDYAGWRVIGRDPAHSFAPPFGFYDKDYPGWQASSPEAEQG